MYDLLYVALPNGGIKPLFPDFVSRRIIAASDKIDEYEVRQKELKTFEIYVKPEFRTAVEQSLLELFTQINCIHPNLIFINNPFPKLPGAKLRRIRREYAPL